MLTPVTLSGMDDKPVIEFHPFGTISFNFDDVTVKLRRCRLGDLQYAKDRLAELRDLRNAERQGWLDEINVLRDQFANRPEGQTDDEASLRAGIDRMNQLADLLDRERIDIIYQFLTGVIGRMGDNPTPPMDEWPLDLFAASTPNDVIGHWQSRPLASGKTSPNGTMREAATSAASPPAPSSPPAPPPQ